MSIPDIPYKIHTAVVIEKNDHIARLEKAIEMLIGSISTEQILQQIRDNPTGEELLETENATLRKRIKNLESAIMPVVDWYVRSKEKFPDDFTENTVILEFYEYEGIKDVTGAQFDALTKLVRGGEE